MSIRLTSQESRVAMFNSTTGIAFGPTFDSEQEAEDFLGSLIEDVRTITPESLQALYEKFMRSS